MNAKTTVERVAAALQKALTALELEEEGGGPLWYGTVIKEALQDAMAAVRECGETEEHDEVTERTAH